MLRVFVEFSIVLEIQQLVDSVQRGFWCDHALSDHDVAHEFHLARQLYLSIDQFDESMVVLFKSVGADNP